MSGREDKSAGLKIQAAIRGLPSAAFPTVWATINNNALYTVLSDRSRSSTKFRARLEIAEAWSAGWSAGKCKPSWLVIGKFVATDTNVVSTFVIVTDDADRLIAAVREIAKVALVQLS